MADQGSSNNESRPKRSLTSMSLAWLAERLRKTEIIKEKVSGGEYEVDSRRVAQSLANKDPES